MAEWKTTDKHFAYFKKQAQAWIQKLGLTNYRVLFLHADDPDLGPSSYGWFKSKGNTANIGLGLTTDRPVTTELLDQVALHECLHLLFDDLAYAATQRFIPMGFIEAEEEQIIARLEKVLLHERQVC